MWGQFINVCGQLNFGSNLPSGNFNFRNSYIPDQTICYNTREYFQGIATHPNRQAQEINLTAGLRKPKPPGKQPAPTRKTHTYNNHQHKDVMKQVSR